MDYYCTRVLFTVWLCTILLFTILPFYHTPSTSHLENRNVSVAPGFRLFCYFSSLLQSNLHLKSRNVPVEPKSNKKACVKTGRFPA